MSANAFLNLVGADDHGHGIPAHQALDAAFHLLAAGKRRLLPRRNRVLIRSGRREWQVDASLTARMQRQLLQKPAGAIGPTSREHIIERVQPLPRFKDFDSVSLLRLSHTAPTMNAIPSS